jgi:hypothetical protein
MTDPHAEREDDIEALIVVCEMRRCPHSFTRAKMKNE